METLLAGIAAFLIGLSRGGLKGIAPLFVLLFTYLYGAKSAAGIIVPLLIFADILALWWYKSHVNVKVIRRFLPYVLTGLILGAVIGRDFSDGFLEKTIASIIVISLVMMWVFEAMKPATKSKPNLAARIVLGVGAGFFSMIGNFAGAFANVYFLLLKIPKNELIATATFVFFVANVCKVPLHVYLWETISSETIAIGFQLLIWSLLGFATGVKIVGHIPESTFRKFLYAVTLLGALLVFV